MPSPFTSFLSELRRRRVFRVAAFYGGIAFVITEIIGNTFSYLGIPDWFGTALIAMLIIGFPVSMVLAWVFDITAEGIVRTKGKAPQSSTITRPLIGNTALAIIAALAIMVAAWSWFGGGGAKEAEIRSIAVLPLDNLGGDPEQVYFVDGMHEAIITNLNRLSDLRVISRTSAMRYKNSAKLLPDIARELGVDALVEGSVLKVGNRVRITAQLIHGATDEHLWANEYESELTDILSLQKTVARAIAGEIGLALKPEEEANLSTARQVNPEAYNQYLKGWYFRSQLTRESLPMAVKYLEQAVELDPSFAIAWAGLANSYFLIGIYNIWDVDSAGTLMKSALDKAFELDAKLPEAFAGLGLYQELGLHDFAGAQSSFSQALELDPNNVYARTAYGYFLIRTGHPDQSMAVFRRALELDPLSAPVMAGVGGIYKLTRQYDKSMEYYQGVLELSPDFSGASEDIVWSKNEIRMQRGHYAEVAANTDFTWLQWARAEWAMGNKEKVYTSRDSLRSSGELQQLEQRHPILAARFYAIIGEQEKSLSLLEGVYEENRKWYDTESLVYAIELDILRAEPRFKTLLQKMGLPEVFDEQGQRISSVED